MASAAAAASRSADRSASGLTGCCTKCASKALLCKEPLLALPSPAVFAVLPAAAAAAAAAASLNSFFSCWLVQRSTKRSGFGKQEGTNVPCGGKTGCRHTNQHI